MSDLVAVVKVNFSRMLGHTAVLLAVSYGVTNMLSLIMMFLTIFPWK